MTHSYINVNAVKARVKDITAAARDPVDVKKTPKAQKIEGLLRKIGSSRQVFAEIFSAILGETLRLPCAGNYFPVGSMIVPIGKKEGGHNYPLNQPILNDKPVCSSALRSDGCVGNSLPKQGSEHIRFATDEEIDTYFDEFNFQCGNSHMGSFIAKL